MIYEITAPIALGGTSEYYVIKSADGFGSAGVENVKWNRPGFDGIKVPKAFWRERIIRLVIGVKHLIRQLMSKKGEIYRRLLIFQEMD